MIVFERGENEYRGNVLKIINNEPFANGVKVVIENEKKEHEEHNIFVSQIIRVVLEGDEKEDPNIFYSLTKEIIEGVYFEFEQRGVAPSSLSEFVHCHLSAKLGEAVIYSINADGYSRERLEEELGVTLDEMISDDNSVAKSLMWQIQNNSSYFEPNKALPTILYDCFDTLGVFNMKNTKIKTTSILKEDKDNCISTAKIKDSTSLYFKNGNYTFIQQLSFGGRKNLIKFALWTQDRSANIGLLYILLKEVVNACKKDEEERKEYVSYPKLNEEISTIYLSQLKALENAI